MNGLPIDISILAMRKEIPVKIAKLSYKNKEKAIHYLRLWGENQLAITELHEQLCQSLQEEMPLVASN